MDGHILLFIWQSCVSIFKSVNLCLIIVEIYYFVFDGVFVINII